MLCTNGYDCHLTGAGGATAVRVVDSALAGARRETDSAGLRASQHPLLHMFNKKNQCLAGCYFNYLFQTNWKLHFWKNKLKRMLNGSLFCRSCVINCDPKSLKFFDVRHSVKNGFQTWHRVILTLKIEVSIIFGRHVWRRKACASPGRNWLYNSDRKASMKLTIS